MASDATGPVSTKAAVDSIFGTPGDGAVVPGDDNEPSEEGIDADMVVRNARLGPTGDEAGPLGVAGCIPESPAADVGVTG